VRGAESARLTVATTDPADIPAIEAHGARATRATTPPRRSRRRAMWLAALAAFFVLATGGALVGLALVDRRTIPPITGTCALILTLVALAVTVLH
ncbi:hypothetical protein ACWGLO_38240, partial [Streptomyces niveus]